MQINRLFEIVYLLMDKKRTTAHELAAHFEVSKRTILRDIDALGTAGIPIYTTQGKGGGIFIEDNFVLNKALVSPDEQKQILFSLQSMAATQLIDTEQILSRLQSFFAGPGREWIEVDFSRWGHSAADNEKFEILKHAIMNEKAVAFDYLSPYAKSKGREVYPLKLAFKSKAWYLQSFCLNENDYRTFKFTRISNMAALDKSFCSSDYNVPKVEPPEDTPLPDWFQMNVRVLPQAMYRIYDEFAENDITDNKDGTFTLSMSDGRWIYDYILSYGTTMEVLEPTHLREGLLAHMEKIKQKYLPKT